MMNILEGCGKTKVPPGIRFIPNYGYVPIPFGPRQQPQESLGQLPRLYPGAIAGNSTRVCRATDVPTCTNVSAVDNSTLLPSAGNPQNLQRGQTQQSSAFPTPGALPTPVKVNSLLFFLQGYPTHLNESLQKGFTEGFQLHFQGPVTGHFSGNLVSAINNPEIVDNKLAKEIHAGRIIGPFDQPPLDNLRVSPLGVIPKKQPGEFRMIHHLSFPQGGSVNDFIPQEFCSVNYATVDNAVQIIRRLGKGCAMAKTDVTSAFRIIPVHPADYHLLGLYWKGKYYVDCCLPMGCASSCKTFESLSTAMEWVAQTKLKIPNIIHILDDFLIVEKSRAACSASLQRFLDFCNTIGVPMAPEKTVGPFEVLTFAGIELDCERFEARLPADKVVKARATIGNMKGRQKVTLRELQSLIGLLNFACSVVVPGRAFLRRLINLTIGVKRPHHYIRLTQQTKKDLQIWECFLESFNGRSLFLQEDWSSSHSLRLYTDAAQSSGFGILFGDQWAYGTWPEKWKRYNICFLEFFPIVIGLSMWCQELRNKRVLFMTDNESLVHVINKQTTKDAMLLGLLRKLVLVCLQNNILFKARHIPGVKNEMADSLSRLQVGKFKTISRGTGMQTSPTQIPAHLLPENWEVG